MLKILNKPEYLKDATKYGFKLELLARAYAAIGNWSPILASEREQMLLGDIPVFYVNTVSDKLVLSNGKMVDVFDFNALESVRHKIRKASLQDYEYQMDLMQEVIAL